MDQLIQNFSNQIKEALEINESVKLSPNSSIQNIILCGIGGSGIGGRLVSEIAADNLSVPFICNHDYSIPNFVGPNTLAIISSYSGNTEETLEAFDSCIKAGAQILCISSEGKVEEIAKANNYTHIKVPGGNAPRTCLAYSLVSQLVSLSKLGLTKKDYRKLLKESIDFIDNVSEYAKSIAMEIASEVHESLPIIYTPAEYSGTGVRLKQQLNENAKMLCWSSSIPEMNHNELVGWASGNDNISAIFFEPEDLHERNKERFNISKAIIRSKGAKIIEIRSKGSTKTERSLYYIHVGDWISYFLSIKNGVDPFEIEVIDLLKDKLASF